MKPFHRPNSGPPDPQEEINKPVRGNKPTPEPPDRPGWNQLDRWLADRLNGYYRSEDYPNYVAVNGGLAVTAAIAITWKMSFPWDILVLVQTITVLVILSRLNYFFVTEVTRVRQLKAYVRAQATNPGVGVAQPDPIPSDVDSQDRQGGDEVSEDRTA